MLADGGVRRETRGGGCGAARFQGISRFDGARRGRSRDGGGGASSIISGNPRGLVDDERHAKGSAAARPAPVWPGARWAKSSLVFETRRTPRWGDTTGSRRGCGFAVAWGHWLGGGGDGGEFGDLPRQLGPLPGHLGPQVSKVGLELVRGDLVAVLRSVPHRIREGIGQGRRELGVGQRAGNGVHVKHTPPIIAEDAELAATTAVLNSLGEPGVARRLG